MIFNTIFNHPITLFLIVNPAGNEAALLIAYRDKDDAAAFEALWQSVEVKLHNKLSAQIKNPADVADVLQSVCIRLSKSLKRTTPDSLIKLSFTITHDEAVNFYRKRDRSQEKTPLEAIMGSSKEPREEMSGDLDQSIIHMVTRMKANGANPDQIYALILHYICGYTAKEIAEITDVPFETARARLRMGLLKLRNMEGRS